MEKYIQSLLKAGEEAPIVAIAAGLRAPIGRVRNFAQRAKGAFFSGD